MSQGKSTKAPGTGRPGTGKPGRGPGPREEGRRPRGAAREALLEAARAEFDEAGFDGTDTNRIARRAGYAPQTFYRHFADKTAVFVEVYHRWLDDEWKDLARARAGGADEAARVLLRHHARHRGFRRSLRLLTTSDDGVRKARAESRRRQLELLGRDDLAAVAMLLCIERIADAAADGELADLGLSRAAQAGLLADVIRRFRSA